MSKKVVLWILAIFALLVASGAALYKPISAQLVSDPEPGTVVPVEPVEDTNTRHFDLIIAGSTVVDGTGGPAFQADIGIIGDRIVAIGDLGQAEGGKTIDASGLVAAPGFIDTHSHTYETIETNPEAKSNLMQGITTVVGGVDGRSPVDIGDHLAEVASRGTGVNYAMLVGHGSIRTKVMGNSDREPTPREITAMKDLVKKAMVDGAFGFSTGLEYLPGRYASTAELIELAQVVAASKGVYATHLRSEGKYFLEAVREAVTVGQEAGMAVCISHFKVVFQANWDRLGQALAIIQRAREEGTEVFVDVYPYLAPDYATNLPLATAINYTDPSRVLIKKARDQALIGKTLADLASSQGLSPAQTMKLLLDKDPGIRAVAFIVSEDNLVQILRQPYSVFSSDASAKPLYGNPNQALRVHPRTYGATARLLGEFVREKGVLTLEQAVHKMTGAPAARFGFDRRGLIKKGFYADLVVFDPETVADRTSYYHPQAYPSGIRYVLVNGQIVVEKGKFLGDLVNTSRPGQAPLAGRVLRH